MNILILNWRDPQHPLAGGAEISVMEHAKYWKKMGADITWFASTFAGAKLDEVDTNGFKIIRKGSHFTVHFWAFIYYLRGRFGKNEIVIDCFHFIPFFTPLYMRKSKKIALIHEVAGKVWYKNMPLPLAFIGFYLEPLFFRAYKKNNFITVSNSTEKELKKLGVKGKNIFVIHNGITLPNVKTDIQKEKKPTVLYLGRISKDKGFRDAVVSYKNIKNKISNLQLWIVGKEEKTGMLKKLIGSDLQDMEYFGFVSEEKKFELLKKAWILIHPSIKEGWGLTVIEAASQGIPTVAYNVPGLSDSIQDGKTGVLVPENPELLAKAIEMLLKDKEKLKILARQAKEWSKNFDWEKSGKKSWEVINNL